MFNLSFNLTSSFKPGYSSPYILHPKSTTITFQAINPVEVYQKVINCYTLMCDNPSTITKCTILRSYNADCAKSGFAKLSTESLCDGLPAEDASDAADEVQPTDNGCEEPTTQCTRNNTFQQEVFLYCQMVIFGPHSNSRCNAVIASMNTMNIFRQCFTMICDDSSVEAKCLMLRSYNSVCNNVGVKGLPTKEVCSDEDYRTGSGEMVTEESDTVQVEESNKSKAFDLTVIPCNGLKKSKDTSTSQSPATPTDVGDPDNLEFKGDPTAKGIDVATLEPTKKKGTTLKPTSKRVPEDDTAPPETTTKEEIGSPKLTTLWFTGDELTTKQTAKEVTEDTKSPLSDDEDSKETGPPQTETKEVQAATTKSPVTPTDDSGPDNLKLTKPLNVETVDAKPYSEPQYVKEATTEEPLVTSTLSFFQSKSKSDVKPNPTGGPPTKTSTLKDDTNTPEQTTNEATPTPGTENQCITNDTLQWEVFLYCQMSSGANLPCNGVSKGQCIDCSS